MRKLKSLAILSTIMALSGNSPYRERIEKEPKKKLSEDEIAEKKGLKKFFYGDNYVYALNKKNADRKARNAGYL